MSVTLSQASIDVIVQTLSGVIATLDKAISHWESSKFDQQDYLNARFFSDMYPFSKQIQVIATWAENIPTILTGSAISTPVDDEDSLESLKARISKALAYVQTFDRAAIDESADKIVTFPIGKNKRTMTGRDFVLHHALPHFFFHTTTAYDLLRHKGLPLVKRDFMGQIQGIIE